MSNSSFLLVHLFGVFVTFLSITLVAGHAMYGGKKADNKYRKLIMALHGLGTLVILVSGFGMLGQLGLTGAFPLWAILKVCIWIIAGALIAIPYRWPALALPLAIALPFLGLLAAGIAIYKPV